jgi:hypothetical protein
MIDPLSTWKSTFKDLPKSKDVSWAHNVAEWYAERIKNIQPDPSVLFANGFKFEFNKGVFEACLSALTYTLDPVSGIAGFAASWVSAISLTIYPATLSLAPGSYIIPPPAPTPATLFSVINIVLLNPPTILAGQAKIMELAFEKPQSDPDNVKFAEKFYEATSLLSISVAGLDTTPPPSGPLPLSLPIVALK